MKTELQEIIDLFSFVYCTVSKCVEYDWDDEFSMKEIREAYEKTQEHLKKIDFTKLNLEELELVRFGKWTENTILCPLYLRKILKPNAHNDARFFCVSEGWPIRNGQVVFNEEKDIFSDKEGEK